MQNSRNQRLVIHTGIIPESAPIVAAPVSQSKKRCVHKRIGAAERLLRNTAVACTLLLGILTIKNVDRPWSQNVMNGIESVLTMRIDPDESLGRMSFVQKLMPESVMVFFNTTLSRTVIPADGVVQHEYTEEQPWTLYSCPEGSNVYSIMPGVVSAVTMLESGDWCVLIEHGEGVEALYAYLERPLVDAGDDVNSGQQIGSLRGSQLYFEYRKNGISMEAGAGD